MYWPSTPMLNMPPLKHTATASAEKISGVALARTYPNPVDVAEGELRDRAEDRERALAVGDGDQAAGEQGDPHRGEERQELSAEALEPRRSATFTDGGHRGAAGGHQPVAASATSPSIPRPTSSGGASGGYSAVIRPS